MRIVRLVRNVEFGHLFDSFFVSAVSTVLIVRFYLEVTGYPQLGNSTLHISHLLPGTILMLAAILLMLAAVNRSVRDFAAVIAGIGFGLSWDELGKFITQSNNYFFKPTLGLIYLTFVALYLVARYAGQRRLSQDDYIANAIDLIKEAAIKDLDTWEYEHAKELMLHVSPNHVLYQPTMEMLNRVKPSGKRRPLLTDRIINAVMSPIHRLSQWRYFTQMVIMIAITYGLVNVFVTMFYLYGALNEEHINISILKGDTSDLAGALSAFITVILLAAGAYYYRRGRHKRAYELFESGLLIEIFVGQIILFFKSPKVAIAGLFITLFLLLNIKLLSAEEAHQKTRRKTLVHEQPV
jgi:tetratricopeptide (TPR) repeat protein